MPMLSGLHSLSSKAGSVKQKPKNKKRQSRTYDANKQKSQKRRRGGNFSIFQKPKEHVDDPVQFLQPGLTWTLSESGSIDDDDNVAFQSTIENQQKTVKPLRIYEIKDHSKHKNMCGDPMHDYTECAGTKSENCNNERKNDSVGHASEGTEIRLAGAATTSSPKYPQISNFIFTKDALDAASNNLYGPRLAQASFGLLQARASDASYTSYPPGSGQQHQAAASNDKSFTSDEGSEEYPLTNPSVSLLHPGKSSTMSKDRSADSDDEHGVKDSIQDSDKPSLDKRNCANTEHGNLVDSGTEEIEDCSASVPLDQPLRQTAKKDEIDKKDEKDSQALNVEDSAHFSHEVSLNATNFDGKHDNLVEPGTEEIEDCSATVPLDHTLRQTVKKDEIDDEDPQVHGVKDSTLVSDETSQEETNCDNAEHDTLLAEDTEDKNGSSDSTILHRCSLQAIKKDEVAEEKDSKQLKGKNTCDGQKYDHNNEEEGEAAHTCRDYVPLDQSLQQSIQNSEVADEEESRHFFDAVPKVEMNYSDHCVNQNSEVDNSLLEPTCLFSTSPDSVLNGLSPKETSFDTEGAPSGALSTDRKVSTVVTEKDMMTQELSHKRELIAKQDEIDKMKLVLDELKEQLSDTQATLGETEAELLFAQDELAEVYHECDELDSQLTDTKLDLMQKNEQLNVVSSALIQYQHIFYEGRNNMFSNFRLFPNNDHWEL